MRKRLIALLAGLSLVLTGCGGDNTETIEQTAEPVQTTAAKAETEEYAAPPAPETAEVTPSVVQTAESAADTADETVEVLSTETAETNEAVAEIDRYVELISAYDNSYLGLPQKDKVYIFHSTGETAEIDGESCYGLSCYDEHEGVLYFMCDFFISEDGGKVYRYYVSENVYSLLPESSSGYTQMDPTTQSPEEIFAVANALYGYFDLCALDGYYDRTLEKEVNGSIRTYYMVSDERLDTKMEMLNALSCYFSADIINSLMDSQLYAEGEDGKLYSTGGARGSDITHISTEYELSILTSDTAEFTAYNSYGDENGEVTYENTMTYSAIKQDGRWFFTSFDLPY